MATFHDRLSSLRASHLRLFDEIDALGTPGLTGPSYCRDWTVAQVLSHLGSGAEIFGRYLDAGLGRGAAPDPASFPAVWDEWNAMTPPEQAVNARRADQAFTERLAALTHTDLGSVRFPMFGTEMGPDQLIGMRLSEHAVHTWDVVVMTEPAATLAADAVEAIMEGLGLMAGVAGKPGRIRVEATVTTSAPDATLLLSVSDVVQLVPAGGAEAEVAQAETGPADTGPATADVHMPAEALIRLVYGRLDPAHTPASVVADGVDLNALRTVFPGF